MQFETNAFFPSIQIQLAMVAFLGGNLWGVGRKLFQPEDFNIPDVVGRSHRALVIWRPLGGISSVIEGAQQVTVHLMVAVKVVKALEDATQPPNPHPIHIHHTSVAQVVDIRSYPTPICQLLLERDRNKTIGLLVVFGPGGNLWPRGFPR